MSILQPPQSTGSTPTSKAESLVPRPPEEPLASPLDHAHPLKADRYFAMIATGVLGKKDRVYLWKGRLVEKMTKGRPHVFAVGSLYETLFTLTPAGWYVEQEQPLMIGDESVPEPDLMIVRGTRRDHVQKPPSAADLALLVEVADSSLAEDLGDVLQTYAAHSIPTYWVVNLRARRVEVYRDPTGPVEKPFYRTAHLYGPNDEVPVEIDGREVGRIAVASILP
jgi:Uma2 family endonuclease